MLEVATCGQCGAPVRRDAPFGYCSKCLVALGFGPLAALEEASPRNDSERSFREYQIVEEIGRGGMGVVYKARQTSLGRMVALKLIRPEAAAAPVVLERFRIEARAAAQLDHRNIIPVYEVGEAGGQPFISMKLIEGCGLNRMITPQGFRLAEEANLPAPELSRKAQLVLAQITSKVARAVHHAHEHGIMHRDLKPSNILMNAENEPFLTDFGLAKVLDGTGELTVSGVVMGTPSYMGPEQASGKARHLTPAADVYSLGAILYELLAGRPPFRGETPLETLRLVTDEEPKHPAALNRHANGDLATIALKCLEKEPSHRYPSAQALAEDLERWLRQEPILARRPSAVLRLRRWVQRKPALAILTGIMVLGLVSASLLLKLSWDAERQAKQDERQIIAENRRALEEELNNLWAGPNAYVAVGSEVRARCWPTEGILPISLGPLLRVVVGVYAHEKPVEAVEDFTPLLAYLEHRMTLALSNTIRLNLLIYRSNADAREALIRGEVDFLRLGAGPYIEAKIRQPEIVPLARQKPEKYSAVVFARADLGIASPSQLRGHSLAFGHVDSTISGFHGKAFLASKGLRLRDFSSHGYHNDHLAALKAVATGSYEAGLAKESMFKKFIREHGVPLKIIDSFKCMSMPWVARSRIQPRVAENFQHALLALQDTNILQALPDNATGFIATSDQDFEPTRKEGEHAKQFDQ